MAADSPGVDLPCPVCEQPARVIDEPTLPDWLRFDGCDCGAFRVWADLVATARLKAMSLGDRQQIQARVRQLRGRQREAWLFTANGRLSGLLVVSSEAGFHRPHRRVTDRPGPQ